MIQQSMIEKILDYSLSCGADYAEVFTEEVKKTEISLTDQQVHKCTGGCDGGIGIRIFRGTESDYLYSADVREESVYTLLKENWKGQGAFTRRDALCPVLPYRLSEVSCYPQDMRLKRKIQILKNSVAAGCAQDKIVQGRAYYVDYDQMVQIANSAGVYAEDRRVKSRVRLIMVARDKDRQQGYVGPGAMAGAEFLENTDLESYARLAAGNARARLGARKSPVGKMPVIIGNGFGGLFFHEACGHSLEGDAVADRASVFSGKLGTRIASEKVTLIDDGSMYGQWGSLGIDDEGNPTQKNILIENGVLKNYLLDTLSARKLNMHPTGCARRENYRFAPASRMTNTYIMPGNDRFEDMLCSVERGLFVKEINAGSVDPLTGEFNFNTGETFLIENGEITVPLMSATLIGKGQDILKKIDMVSDDFALGQGYCYAGSGSLFIGAGQPTVRIAEMTVGGKDI